MPFSRELYIERDDFREDPPKKFFRLSPGREVRLRCAYFMTCTEVVKDAHGEIVELRCTYDPATRGGDAPDGRRVKATLHWVSAAHALPVEVRLYDRLFSVEDPGRASEGQALHRLPQPGLARSAAPPARSSRASPAATPGRRDSSSNGWATSVSILIPRRARSSSIAPCRSGTPGRKSNNATRSVPELILQNRRGVPAFELGASNLSRSAQQPVVSMEGYARFEQRARERRIEGRLQAARTAIRSSQWADARAALDELKELDQTLPELAALALQLAAAEKRTGSHRGNPRRGAFAAAAAAFVAVLLAASSIENIGRLRLRLIVETAAPAIVETAAPEIVETAASAPVPDGLLASRGIALDLPIATSGGAGTTLSDAVADPPAVPVPPSRPTTTLTPSQVSLPAAASRPAASSPSAPASAPAPAPRTPSVSSPSQLELPPATAPEPLVAPPARPPVAPAPVAPASVATTAASSSGAALDVASTTVDESAQVKALLQKYQAGYERLDAGLVHEVWPGVNEAALARAFGGLESQALDFKTCYIQLHGTTADVLCTGSTRYVPKVGSREPRVEPLSWTFSLRKRPNDDWQIESARADR